MNACFISGIIRTDASRSHVFRVESMGMCGVKVGLPGPGPVWFVALQIALVAWRSAFMATKLLVAATQSAVSTCSGYRLLGELLERCQ